MGVDNEITTPGDGETFPKSGDELTMHYTGTLKATGAKFDSSVDRNKPFQFVIGIGQVTIVCTLMPRAALLMSDRCPQVIRGWDEGVIKMSLGEKAVLHISSDFGYGERGAPGAIPPNADLDFEVSDSGLAIQMPRFPTRLIPALAPLSATPAGGAAGNRQREGPGVYRRRRRLVQHPLIL